MKTLNTYKDETMVQCDQCGFDRTVDGTDYIYVNEQLRADCWVVTKVEGKWCDFCGRKCERNFRYGD